MKFGPKIGCASNPWVWQSHKSLGVVLAVAALALGHGIAQSEPSNQKRPADARSTKKSPKPAKDRQRHKSSHETAASKRKNEKLAGLHKSQHRRAQRAEAPLAGPADARAFRYAGLTREACLRELVQRQISYREEPGARGVSIPVRLEGPVAGVLYRTDLNERERKTCPWEVFDCRLVLSLSDLGELLRAHEIVEARIFSAWRPPAKSAVDPVGKRHQGALAVDVRTFRKADGSELSVLDDFEGQIGQNVCDSSREPARPEGRELKEIVCGAADAHLFNSILTPNYDVPHRNHFHLELAPGKSWFLLR